MNRSVNEIFLFVLFFQDCFRDRSSPSTIEKQQTPNVCSAAVVRRRNSRTFFLHNAHHHFFFLPNVGCHSNLVVCCCSCWCCLVSFRGLVSFASFQAKILNFDIVAKCESVNLVTTMWSVRDAREYQSDRFGWGVHAQPLGQTVQRSICDAFSIPCSTCVAHATARLPQSFLSHLSTNQTNTNQTKCR